MQLALRVEVVDQVCNGASTLQVATHTSRKPMWEQILRQGSNMLRFIIPYGKGLLYLKMVMALYGAHQHQHNQA